MNARPWVESAKVELLLFIREPTTTIFALAMPVIFTVILGAVFGDTPDQNGAIFRGVGGSTYYAPAYIGLAAASVGLVILPTHLAGYRERGILRRLRASGVPVSAVLLGQVAVALVLTAVGGVLVVLVSFASAEPAAKEMVHACLWRGSLKRNSKATPRKTRASSMTISGA